MLVTRGRTKRPREALLQLDIGLLSQLFSIGGRSVYFICGSSVRYHPVVMVSLTLYHSLRFRFRACLFLLMKGVPRTGAQRLVRGQYLAGSLTGAVASQTVTEAFTKVG